MVKEQRGGEAAGERGAEAVMGNVEQREGTRRKEGR
jgi:hypothetical protein